VKIEMITTNKLSIKFQSERSPVLLFDKVSYTEDELCSVLFELVVNVENFLKTKSCAIVLDNQVVGVRRK
jgi:hypothetical protein